jgi:hypothetical protein
MKKDITIEEVRDVAIAIVPELNEHQEYDWMVHFLNLKDKPLTSVLINAEARGMIDGVEKHTAVMRFYIEEVGAQSSKKFEMLMPDTFLLNNQYWVSFYEDGQIFEKKFVFAANTISRDRMVMIPVLSRAGVMMK